MAGARLRLRTGHGPSRTWPLRDSRRGPRPGAELLALTLLLLAIAGALLGLSLSTGGTLWAWASAGTSALAAVLLLTRSWRSRRAGGGRHHAPRAGRPTAAAPTDDAPADETAADATAAAATAAAATAAASSADDDGADPDAEPDEEPTRSVDRPIVAELEDEVRVVDERPRYHLDGCSVLEVRASETLPVREALELGFTPCARCGPDTKLAARHRATTARYFAPPGR